MLIGATGAAGNAATRLEPFVTKNGIYAYGALPEIEDLFQRQAREMDRKKREALLHQIQQILARPGDARRRSTSWRFIWGVGPRVEEAGARPDPGLPVLGARSRT